LHASSAVLGWGLATAGSIGMAPSHLQIFYTFSPANFSPAVLGWRLLTCSFFLADFSHAVLGWHRPGLPNSPQKKYQWNHGGFATTSTRLPLKMQNSPKTKMIKGIVV